MKKTAYATVIVSVAAALSGLKVRADESTAMTTGSTPTVSTTSSAGKLGVGLIVGEPTGISAKYWLNDTLALDGAVGWSSHDHTDLYLHSDVLWHNFDLLPVSRGSLPVYFGVGGLVRFRDDNRDNDVGVRVPVGVSYLFDTAPIDVFAEIAPAVDVAPSVRGEITGGVGIHYWF